MQVSFTSSRGQSIIFGAPTYRIISIEGLGNVDAENQFQKSPYRDGSRFLDSILTERIITIEAKVRANNEVELSERRRFLSRIFNPKNGLGEFNIKIGDKTYTVDAVSDFIPQFGAGAGNMGDQFHAVQIQLTAPQPYWREPEQVSRALRAYTGTFKMPFSFPIQFGVSGDSTVLDNEGDVDAPVTIDIQGPIVNPQIINDTTGEFITIGIALSNNQILHIDTDDNNKRVELYEDGLPIFKAIGYMTHDSEFWKLAPGENRIRHIADSGNKDAIISVGWHNYYAGI